MLQGAISLGLCASKKRQKRGTLFFLAAMTVLTVGVGLTAVLNLLSPELPASLDNAIPVIAVFEKNPYAQVYYYEADKQQRYERYQVDHADLVPEDVVWQVNAGLDQDFYTNIITITDTEVMPLIVNKYHQLPADYVPAGLDTPTVWQASDQSYLCGLQSYGG